MSLEYFVTHLKTACEEFLKSPNRNSLKKIRKLIQNIESSQLDTFQSLILLPLVLCLDGRCENQIRDQIIDCIISIISSVRIKNLDALKTIIVVVLKQIHDFDTGRVKPCASEELKLSAMECIKTTLFRSNYNVINEFYTQDYSTLISRVTITLVDIVNNEKYKKLRLKAIECIMETFRVHGEEDFSDVVLRNQVADVIFLFLPKVSQTFFKVATGDDKQGETLISASIKALGRILCLIFEDYDKQRIQMQFEVTDFIQVIKENNLKNVIDNDLKKNHHDDEVLFKSRGKNIEEEFKRLKSVGRCEPWFRASSRKLKYNIFDLMNHLRAHPSVIIRLEYTKMCCNLFEKCSKNLKENCPNFFENIIALSQDENENTRRMCIECINKFQDLQSKQILNEYFESLFEKCITYLPRIIHRSDEIEQLKEFLLLKGLIQISLQYDFKIIISFRKVLMKRFCLCLLSFLNLKSDNELLLEEYTLRDINNKDNLNHLITNKMPWRRFKYCDSLKVIKVVEDIFAILGKNEISFIMYDHLNELLLQKTTINNEVILSLTLLITQNYNTSIDVSKLIYALLDELLNEFHWNLNTKLKPKRLVINKNTKYYIDKTPGLYESGIETIIKDEDKDSCDSLVTIDDIKFNILHICVLLDAIGNLSLSLGNGFRVYIYKALQRILITAGELKLKSWGEAYMNVTAHWFKYVISLSFLGSNNFMISRASNYALNCIKTALGFETIQDFFQEYSNLISFYVNQLFKKGESFRSALDILNAIFQYNWIHDTSQIYVIILTILDEIARPEKFLYASLYISVFYKFLLYLQNQLINSNEDIYIEMKNVKQYDEDLYENMLDILNKSDESDKEIEIKDKIENVNEISDEIDTNKINGEISEDIELLPQHMKIIIGILKQVLKFVSSKEQMHKILSIECLAIGLSLCKDYENEFLQIVHLIWYPFTERFKDISDSVVLNRCFDLLRLLCIHAKDFLLQRTLNDIVPYLNKFLEDSSQCSLKEHHLTQTQKYKLQLKLLKYYADIITSMEINGKELDEISEIIILYLNKKQPRSFQEYAVKYFNDIYYYDKPFVNVKLNNYLKNCEYEKNIQLIIKLLSDKKST